MQAKKIDAADSLQSFNLEESVSAWVDHEQTIDVDQLDTPYGRQLWESYHLIGDVLRNEKLAIEPSELFYARVSKAIDDEPVVFAPSALKPPVWRRWLIPTTSLGAALLVTLWLVQPTHIEEVAPVLASVDDVWVDYIDAHRSMTGVGPASYVSYSIGN